ncbi:MAG: hemerythrin domain-containing protein [Solirubrobacteraceae bacterium]
MDKHAPDSPPSGPQAPSDPAQAEAGTLAVALEREHREIDGGIESYLAAAPDDPRSIDPLKGAMDALRRHIFLEEEFLFPPLRTAGLVAPIFVMMREHGEIWDTLELLDRQLAQSGHAEATRKTCRTLLDQLERHNFKEEPIIYPQADATLTPAQSESLHAFLASGFIAPGWICAGAGSHPR